MKPILYKLSTYKVSMAEDLYGDISLVPEENQGEFLFDWAEEICQALRKRFPEVTFDVTQEQQPRNSFPGVEEIDAYRNEIWSGLAPDVEDYPTELEG